jgi:hypothetical protein
MKLGMEEAYFLWLDRWHPDGILYRVYGHRTVYDAACSLEAKVDSVLKNEEWNWKPEKSEELVIIQSKLNMVKIKEKDSEFWLASSSGQFCGATWERIKLSLLIKKIKNKKK